MIGEIRDRALIEEPVLDQPHSSRDGGSRPAPRGASRCRFRSTAQAWPEARPLGRGCRGKELNILRLRGPHRANRATVDAGRSNTGEKHTVESGITRQTRAIARLPIEP